MASFTTSCTESQGLLGSHFLPPVAKWLKAALQDAAELYRAEKYDAAASRLSAALQDCSKGAVLVMGFDVGNPGDVNFGDISKVLSFIESRLVACFLKMRKPDLALPHSYRSICQFPINFNCYVQQAVVYGMLGNSCMAVRNAMIADYMLQLSGNNDLPLSNRIKLHWQRMLEEAVHKLTDFSVLYTPCSGKPTRGDIVKAEQALSKLGPNFTAYFYTDPDGGHFLPKTTDWSAPSPTRYILTLGFKHEQDGIFLNNLLHNNSYMSTGPQSPFMLLAPGHPAVMCEHYEKKILPVLDFINCTKLSAGFSTGSGVIERLQYADCLLQLKREQEHEQVLEQILAELAVAPYLQDISPSDTRLLQMLIADTTDALDGKKTDCKCVLNGVKQQLEPTVNLCSEGMSASSEPITATLRTNTEENSHLQHLPSQFYYLMHSHPQQPPMYLYPHSIFINNA